MSYAEDLKQKLNNDNSGPISAVIYARVSTDNDGQKDSCSNQVELAEKYIAKHPNITIVGRFVDDGISGKNDFTRPQYNEMLNQIKSGKVDLIITKALSRLNRDQLNSLSLQSLLVEKNATILTLEDCQIHDFEDFSSDLLHSISFAIDAQYVKKQSLNGKKTQELRCERKTLTAKDCQSYGYDWHSDTKEITVNEEEAEVVRRIFEEYVYRNGTPASIQKELRKEGIIKSSKTISNIIMDERYIGNFFINKQTSKLGMGKIKTKRIKLPKEQWILIERPDLQIVDSDLFEMAQRVHQARITVHERSDKKSTQARFLGTHEFASKIFCPVCGKPYHFGYSDRAKKKPIYEIKNHSDCPNPIRRISERDLEEITKQVLKRAIEQQDEVCKTVEAILAECVESSRNNTGELAKLKKQKALREAKIDSLIETLSEGGLTESAKDRIKGKMNTITEEINKLADTIKREECNRISDNYVNEKIAKIKSGIKDLRNFTEIDRARILNYIERIELPANGDVDIFLKSGQIISAASENSNSSKGEDAVKKGTQGTMDPYPPDMPILRQIC